MPRSLPLGADLTSAESASSTEPPVSLSGAVAVFDPPLCCPTGVCGPGVDPALLQLSRDLRWLTAQGVTVERFGLSQEPAAFVANPRVAGLMQAFGDGALPAVLVNGAVLAYGRYPSREELVAALAGGGPVLSSAPARRPITVLAGDAPGCEPGSGCC